MLRYWKPNMYTAPCYGSVHCAFISQLVMIVTMSIILTILTISSQAIYF